MTEENHSKCYFAYGSNMNPDRMHDRGVTFTSREVARLPGYELVLNKVIKSNGTAAANIIAKKESTVFGVLYSCDDNHMLERLDKFEGVLSKQYQRQVLSVYNESGEEVKAHVYIAHEKNCRDDLKINPEYLEHLLAAKDILPTQYYSFLKSFENRLISRI